MNTWTPSKEWSGQDVIIIGGGASLMNFDFGSLKGQNIIGCNDAFKLGPEVVKICAFGDWPYFERTKWDLEKFGGRVVSFAPEVLPLQVPWLLKMKRVSTVGLSTGDTVAWNYNTGAAAINLAVSLGASRIFLLGYDLGGTPDRQTHWHPYYSARNTERTLKAFPRFARGFESLFNALAHQHPTIQVYNVTDGSSALKHFRRMTFKEFKERKSQ